MNYGYNYTSSLIQSEFLYFRSDKISLTISNTSFEYNLAINYYREGVILYFSDIIKVILDNCDFIANIGTRSSAIYVKNTNTKLMNWEDTSLTHINITNCIFDGNGSTNGSGVVDIEFPEDTDLYTILIENNIFKRNANHAINSAIVKIRNFNDEITTA